MKLKVEVFVSEPSCSGGRLLLKLVDEIKQKYGEKLNVAVHKGKSEESERYGIKKSPAIVIDQDIRLVGLCPSRETLEEALREAGIGL